MVLNGIDNSLIKKRNLVKSLIDRDETLILSEEVRLSSQEKQFLKQTRPEALTLKKQFTLAKTFGSGGVSLGFKQITASNKRARKRFIPKFKKAKKEISKSKKSIKSRRESIPFITEDTIIGNFGIDLSKLRVDTGFNF